VRGMFYSNRGYCLCLAEEGFPKMGLGEVDEGLAHHCWDSFSSFNCKEGFVTLLWDYFVTSRVRHHVGSAFRPAKE